MNQSAAQWQVALAALGTNYSPAQPTFDDAALASWNGLIAQGWTQLRWRLEPVITGYIQQALASVAGGAVIGNVGAITMDFSAPPAFTNGGGAAPFQTLVANLPAPPQGWSLAVTADASWVRNVHLAGLPLSSNISADVTIHVDDVRVIQPMTFDFTDRRRPVVKSTGTPQLSMRLSVTTSSTLPVVQQLVAGLTTVLDPVVRAGLILGATAVQNQIGVALGSLPTTPWGLGGAAVTTVTAPADLLSIADGVSAEVQKHHIPFATNVYPAVFDQPGYGNGQVVDFTDYGDSAIWTGHYIAAEAFRYDITQSPAALAGATTALGGITADLDIDGPGSGLLGRCAIPVADPHIAGIAGWGAVYYGDHDGVRMGALGYISRDQYIGAVLGATTAWLRVPSLKPAGRDIITRVCSYLAANQWGAYDHNAPVVTAGFTTSPDVLWAFVAAANLVDRGTWGFTHDQNAGLASILWFPIWLSSREVHDGYYKFNLMHSTQAILAEAETDPLLYREYMKGLEIAHDAVGHHQNAWFDVVYGLSIPTAAPAIGPLVKSELEHWALRPRRTFPSANSQDPAIAKTLYTPVAVGGGTPHWVADTPIPIEKRVAGDYLWQTDPFQLDSGGDGKVQYPGIDLLLPYWTARSFGMIR